LSLSEQFFCFKAEDCIRHRNVTGVQTCALPISVFVFNQNISNPKILKSIVQDLYKNNETINTATILDLANSKKGQELLQDDFNVVRQLGVRGFPTIVIVNSVN